MPDPAVLGRPQQLIRERQPPPALDQSAPATYPGLVRHPAGRGRRFWRAAGGTEPRAGLERHGPANGFASAGLRNRGL